MKCLCYVDLFIDSNQSMEYAGSRLLTTINLSIAISIAEIAFE